MLQKLKFTLVVLIFSNLPLLAQKTFDWKTAQSGGYTYKYVTNDPMKAHFYTLKNGLTVILSENHKEPRIQALIPTRAGSNTDPSNHTGLAHYLEHMLFKGTDKFGTVDWAKEKSDLLKALPNLLGHLVFVSNEVGMGIVPLGEINRQFQDEQGRLNQAFASICDSVTFVAAGLPLTLK